ncbi:uncharacterized protein BKA55DRAFT_742796 [Fusarium redolens]|uniref:Uncharacterized protein n=1 Tax=Fusarium redolens TaxID=48865 RepID=A0A9P9JU80_FUSRE|nr:uncharacterized protein BKA55DRAFT_742796 [Fusarium redolens]KAH7232365.1 hypothetical protein BKA55DRAFT_742796 [Fusarium redolens]
MAEVIRIAFVGSLEYLLLPNAWVTLAKGDLTMHVTIPWLLSPPPLSLVKLPTASRNITLPDSTERARAAVAGGLPQSLVEVKREIAAADLNVDFYKTVPLDYEEYKSAREEIEESFRRFDYNPFKGNITIRMNSPIHDNFAGLVDNAWVRAFSASLLSSRIYLDNEKQPSVPVVDDDKREQKGPDLQYSHVKSKHPGVVVEVAYTQKAKKLDKLAEAYILGTKGKIRVVDGCGRILEAEQVVKAMPFCDANQRPVNQGHELTINLHDLTAKKDLLVDVQDLSISFRYDELCGFLYEMEEMQQCREAEESEDEMPTEPKRRISSSPEQLTSEDEEEELQQDTKGDRSFSCPVGHLTRPNVSTRSSSKQPASEDTGAGLPIAKRQSKRPMTQRREE